jgi:hypothetical protein
MTDSIPHFDDPAAMAPVTNGTVNMADIEMKDDHPTEVHSRISIPIANPGG